MKKIFIIPDRLEMEETLALTKSYSLGFEYNDFISPDVLDDEGEVQRICEMYKMHPLPEFCTIHGTFFDVIPCSPDARIREISNMRIEQSLKAAIKIGASAVIFHTNYNPFLNSKDYIEKWTNQNATFWSSILEKYSNINIYLENMFDLTPNILEKLSEQLCNYDNYGVCLDFAHAVLSTTHPKIWAEHLGKYIKHIHINDNDLISDLHLAWGKGKIDRRMFYDCYEKYMQGASVLIETSSMKNRIESLEKLKEEGFL